MFFFNGYLFAFTLKGICLADNSKRSAEPEPQPNPNVDVTVNEEGELEDYYDDGNRLRLFFYSNMYSIITYWLQ